jgi:hypothetical protein
MIQITSTLGRGVATYPQVANTFSTGLPTSYTLCCPQVYAQVMHWMNHTAFFVWIQLTPAPLFAL